MTLKNKVVAAAFQLESFLFSGHKDSSVISESTRTIIEHITSVYPRPLALSRQDSVSDSASFSESGERRRRSEAKKKPIWPQNWANDRPCIRKNVKDFDIATAHLVLVTQALVSTATRPTTADSGITEELPPVSQAITTFTINGFTETQRTRYPT